MWSMRNKPVWDVADEGAGAAPAPAPDAAPAADAAPAVDPASVLYPDDKAPDAAASTDAEKAADATEADKADAPVDGEWAEYVDDPAKTPEENAAAKLENDLKHPINQIPEDGVYNLTMPEGVELDADMLAIVAPTLKELNMSHGNAQALVDKFIEAQTAKAEAATKRWGETITGWLDSAKNDPDMGGAKWDDTARDASSVVRRFGTPELRDYLEASGAGNHPEVIRLMAKVGSMIAEDQPAISENPGAKSASDPAARLYPNDTPKGK